MLEEGLPRTTKRAGVEGTGMFVLDDVCSGQRIIEYTDNRICGRHCEYMQWSMDYQGIYPNLQVQVTSENAVIDSRGIGNDVAKVNHHCEPNSQLK